MTWCRGDLLRILDSGDYKPLCEKKICKIDSQKKFYVNGFEFGMFSSIKICRRLSKALYSLGFIPSDVLTPYIISLAHIRGYSTHYDEIITITWSKEIVLGVLRRPDAERVLTYFNEVNGYEFAAQDEELSAEVGRLIFVHNIKLSNVVRYKVFKNVLQQNKEKLFFTLNESTVRISTHHLLLWKRHHCGLLCTYGTSLVKEEKRLTFLYQLIGRN